MRRILGTEFRIWFRESVLYPGQGHEPGSLLSHIAISCSSMTERHHHLVPTMNQRAAALSLGLAASLHNKNSCSQSASPRGRDWGSKWRCHLAKPQSCRARVHAGVCWPCRPGVFMASGCLLSTADSPSGTATRRGTVRAQDTGS